VSHSPPENKNYSCVGGDHDQRKHQDVLLEKVALERVAACRWQCCVSVEIEDMYACVRVAGLASW
jgi:hypothetical protein